MSNSIKNNKVEICNSADLIEFINELNIRRGKIHECFSDPSNYYRDCNLKQAMYSYEEYKACCTF